MVREGEEGMIHSVLTGVPEMWDGEEVNGLVEVGKKEEAEALVQAEIGSSEEKQEDSTVLDDTLVDTASHTGTETETEGDAETTLVGLSPSPNLLSAALPDVKMFKANSQPAEEEITTPSPPEFGEAPVPATLLDESFVSSRTESEEHEQDPTQIPLPPSRSASHSRAPTPSTTSPWDRKAIPKSRPTVKLTSLLTYSDALMSLYPPSHPSLRVEQTMGPKSVIRTWIEPRLNNDNREDGEGMEVLSDEECEAIVRDGKVEDIVLPWDPMEDMEDDSDVDHEQEDEEEQEEKSWFGLRRRRRSTSYPQNQDEKRLHRLRKPHRPSHSKATKPHKKLRKSRRPFFFPSSAVVEFDRRTMIAGAAIVLGVAMAVYATSRGGGAGGGAGGRRMGGLIGVLGEIIVGEGGGGGGWGLVI